MVNSNEKWFHNATSDVLAGNCIRFDSDWNTVCLSAWWRYLGSSGVACTACSLIHYFFFFYFSWIRIFISTELAQQAFGSSISRWANYIFVFCFYYYFTIFSFALTVVDDCLPFSRHFVCSNWTIKIMRFDCFWHFFFIRVCFVVVGARVGIRMQHFVSYRYWAAVSSIVMFVSRSNFQINQEHNRAKRGRKKQQQQWNWDASRRWKWNIFFVVRLFYFRFICWIKSENDLRLVSISHPFLVMWAVWAMVRWVLARISHANSMKMTSILLVIHCFVYEFIIFFVLSFRRIILVFVDQIVSLVGHTLTVWQHIIEFRTIHTNVWGIIIICPSFDRLLWATFHLQLCTLYWSWCLDNVCWQVCDIVALAPIWPQTKIIPLTVQPWLFCLPWMALTDSR